MRDLLRQSDALARLGERDRAFAFRLAMGVAATAGQLDALLEAHLSRPRGIEPRVRDALRLSAFELCWMETPVRAAVSQGVELVRSVSPRAAGVANAVLRRVADDDRPRILGARQRCGEATCDASDLALATGVPGWLVGELFGARGMDMARRMLAGRLEAAPTMVTTNPMRHDAEAARDLLSAAGLSPQPALLPEAFVLGAPAGLAASGLVESTDVVVADVAAQLVVRLLSPLPGDRVLEIGQGRGTKTLLMQFAAWGKGGFAQVDAVDSEPFKTQVAQRRMEAAGLVDAVHCHTLDGRMLADAHAIHGLSGAYDLVFLDAPCSGSGTMRRHPEIAWQLDPSSVDASRPSSLPTLQRELLEAAATRVAPGGTLAYSTCSALPQEDEDIVRAFLSGEVGARFCLVPATARLGEGPADGHVRSLAMPWATEEGFLLTERSQGDLGPADTHFLALLQAKS